MFNYERHSGKLLITCVILFIFMLSFFIAFLVEKNKSPEIITSDCQATDDNFTVCHTPACQASGKYILEYINFSTNPCHDFYEYACGNWQNKHPVPQETVAQFGTLDVVGSKIRERLKDLLKQPHNSTTDAVDKARLFYKSCIYEDTSKAIPTNGLQEMKELLAKIGGWPLIGDKWVDSGTWNWWETVARVKNDMGIDAIMGTDVRPNPLNTTKYSFYLQMPKPAELRDGRMSIPLPVLNPTKNFDYDEAIREALMKDLMGTVCRFNSDSSICNSTTTTEEIKNIFDLEKDLQTLAEKNNLRKRETPKGIVQGDTVFRSPNVFRSDHQEISSYIMKVTDLKGKIEGIDWERFITIILEDSEIDAIAEMEVVAVTPYLTELIELINGTMYSNETVANYICWKVVEHLKPYASASFQDIKSESESENSCVDLTEAAMGFAVTNLYASSHLGPEDIAHAKNLIENIRRGIHHTLIENRWLDQPTKERAIKKLEMMQENVGFPLWNTDTKSVNEYYSKLPELSEKEFLKNGLGAMKVNFLNDFSNLNVSVERKNAWPMKNPMERNSFYYPNLNNFYLIAGVLDLPIFSKDNLESLNHGGVGYIIGHEMMHGFDDTGAEFDEVGQYQDWWSKQAKYQYEQKKTCMASQYTKPLEAIPTLIMNGTKTLGENIADNGGIKGTYWGYKAAVKDDIRLPGLENISGDKLFFISAAQLWCTNTSPGAALQLLYTDEHSPAKYRVNIPFGNSVEFENAFKCNENTKMYISNKCVIF